MCHVLLSACHLEPSPWHNSFLFLPQLCASDSFLQSPEALEKKKQWLEYDQQREVYVSSVMARILWLEQQLNEANRALSKQHNEEHSDGEPVGSGHSTLGLQGATDCHNKVFKISRLHWTGLL